MNLYFIQSEPEKAEPKDDELKRDSPEEQNQRIDPQTQPNAQMSSGTPMAMPSDENQLKTVVDSVISPNEKDKGI